MSARSRLGWLESLNELHLASQLPFLVRLIQQGVVLMDDPIPVVFIGNPPRGLAPAIRPLLGVILNQLDALRNVFDGMEINRSVTRYLAIELIIMGNDSIPASHCLQ